VNRGGIGGGAPLVDGAYTAWFLVRLAINFAAGVAVLHSILYFVLSRPLAGEYADVYYALRDLARYQRPILAVSVLAYVLLASGMTAALCVYGLHRVAGPIYRLQRQVERYLDGDPTRPISFRHGDQLGPLADAFNGWIEALRQDRQRWLSRMEEADRLCLQDEATCRAEMERALRDIEADIARYR
jgi:hypothetical protein